MEGKSTEKKRMPVSELLANFQESHLLYLENHLELARMLANEWMANEAESFAGKKYSRNKPHGSRYSRWGHNPSSFQASHQRVRIDVPRIFDKEAGEVFNVPISEQIRALKTPDEKALKAMLYGLSTRNFGEVVTQLADSFGLSKSALSAQFVEQSAKKVKEFMERDLSGNTYCALFLDGKRLGKGQMMIALGITDEGQKVLLGFSQMEAEKATPIQELLENLLARGFSYDEGLLVVVDGAKGIHKAVQSVFGSAAVIQRCTFHKRQNVLSYLSKERAAEFDVRLKDAWNTSDFEKAKEALLKIHEDLYVLNVSAANSLMEGLEDTLTLQKLGVHKTFQRSFATTNCIESVNSSVESCLRNVKFWKNSEMRSRWLAAALLDIESNLGKVTNHKKLDKLKLAIKETVVPLKTKLNNETS